ncbi:uncharacterized protein RHIMIDRAFT_237616 [Rhizopus microsporus ATCC 52813]|uniref:Uncharacterized protein n=1 Tax=Rhizopus microsporus ATCC 52813 TaxID=1340429 RepID=A0A2G4SVB1_RHIZD|nr:uncharacterized protein RHIMIDRAFT_237616 [Rhizopus microsporus ATCC 52813]PHZ12700.1 hypothetical protein RHIMIDRAFT_237616 [Rhizopus microsporus ATCC 52813]
MSINTTMKSGQQEKVSTNPLYKNTNNIINHGARRSHGLNQKILSIQLSYSKMLYESSAQRSTSCDKKIVKINDQHLMKASYNSTSKQNINNQLSKQQQIPISVEPKDMTATIFRTGLEVGSQLNQIQQQQQQQLFVVSNTISVGFTPTLNVMVFSVEKIKL